jgi:hypothetical protein
VVKNNGLSILRAPIFIENRCAIFSCDRCHGIVSFWLFSGSESLIDLEITTVGNVVAANAAAPPISMSRRVNLAIHRS